MQTQQKHFLTDFYRKALPVSVLQTVFIHLAPFYDAVCTKLYESSTDEMSVSINGKQNINQVTRKDLEHEAKKCGLGSKIAMKIYDELNASIQKALLDSAEELSKTGFTEAQSMAENILGKILR